MRRCIFVLIAVIMLSVAINAEKKVFVKRISCYDNEIRLEIAPLIVDWLFKMDVSITTKSDEADYLVQVKASSVTFTRSFNWYFLLFPAWPFVPFTTPEASVILDLSIELPDGEIYYSDQAAGTYSVYWFGDLMSSFKMKKGALDAAFKAVTTPVTL
mgnify:FL=1